MYNKRGVLGHIQENCVIDEKGCWNWARIKKDKYARFTFNGKTFQGHRFIWEICNGEIPEGYQVQHKCHNSICVNPFHLNIGKAQDNSADVHIQRLEEKERMLQPANQKNNLKIIGEAEKAAISEILEETKYNKRKTADKLGISTTTLWRKIKKYGI